MLKSLLVSLFVCSNHAFSPVLPTSKAMAHSVSSPSLTRLQMMSPFTDILSDSSFLLSTIDADIANIPTNEFRTVFLGGLGVIAGGFLSAVAVGAILEASDGYAAVVAESYDLEADEEFWKGLSDEEAKKAREMLQKVKQQRGETTENIQATTPPLASTSLPSDESKNSQAKEPSQSLSTENKSVDMFSDY